MSFLGIPVLEARDLITILANVPLLVNPLLNVQLFDILAQFSLTNARAKVAVAPTTEGVIFTGAWRLAGWE